MKEDCSHILKQMTCKTSLTHMMESQEEIRAYIQTNYKEIDISKSFSIASPTSHPDIFAIFISLLVPKISAHSSFQTILEASTENRWQNGFYSLNETDFDTYGSNSKRFRCACNHSVSPKNVTSVHNINTDICIAIGDDCNKKCKLISPEEKERVKKERNSDKDYIKLQKFIDDDNHKKHCAKLKSTLQTKYKLSIKDFNETFVYSGGNFDQHLTYFKSQSPDTKISDIIEPICCLCNNIKQKQIAFVNQECECVSACVKCVHVITNDVSNCCIDCGIQHINLTTKYCDNCKTKTNCRDCKQRSHCCSEGLCCVCVEKYCRKCKSVKVMKPGYACKQCIKKCVCGKYITNDKYSVCFTCNQARKCLDE